MRTLPVLLVALAVLAALTPAVSGALPANPAVVAVLNYRFEDRDTDSSTTVANVGEPVTFVWGSGSVPHTVSSRAGLPSSQSFDSGVHASPYRFEVTFGAPGVYTYVCKLHPSMTGTIVVVAT